MKYLNLVLFGLLICPMVEASNDFDFNGLHEETVSTIYGKNGESEHLFVKSINPTFIQFSHKTGFEACGFLRKNKQNDYLIEINTNDSHLACVNVNIKNIDGFSNTGVTVHSHGIDKSFNLNRNDRKLFGSTLNSNVRVVYGENIYHFSDIDFKSGPGYLETPNGVIYQNGKNGTIEETIQ